MKYGSVCSGIEAASVAWHPLGWRASFLSEIEAFPRAVLSHHYPDTALHGDFTTIQTGQYEPIDLLVGGTPCQSFSVAGLRGGMADERGNLALEYLRLADRLRPRWLVWENVPGVLSSNGGRDFGSFLGGLGQLGYGFAYRVLDAQFFGLAQRRKRVFVVGYLGDWRRAAAVLFEPASLRWNPAPSREKGEGLAASLTRGADSSGKGGYAGRRREDDTNIVANPLGAKRDGGWRGDLDNDTYVSTLAPAISASNPYGDHESREGLLIAGTLGVRSAHHTSGLKSESDFLVPVAFDTTQITSRENRCNPQVGDACHPLAASAHAPAIAFGISSDAVDRSGEGDGSAGERAGLGITADASPALRARGNNSVAFRSAVRRLTPRECERLQGFPDDYTLISYRGKPAADGPRYRALGNSMARTVMLWIGRRIHVQEAEIQAARIAA